MALSFVRCERALLLWFIINNIFFFWYRKRHACCAKCFLYLFANWNYIILIICILYYFFVYISLGWRWSLNFYFWISAVQSYYSNNVSVNCMKWKRWQVGGGGAAFMWLSRIRSLRSCADYTMASPFQWIAIVVINVATCALHNGWLCSIRWQRIALYIRQRLRMPQWVDNGWRRWALSSVVAWRP